MARSIVDLCVGSQRPLAYVLITQERISEDIILLFLLKNLYKRVDTHSIFTVLECKIISLALLCTFSSFAMSCIRHCRLRNWMRYSNQCFVQPVWLSLLTVVFHRLHTGEAALLDAHCLEGFALLCIITPKPLSFSQNFNTYKGKR